MIISLFSVWALDAIFVPIPNKSKINELRIRFVIGLKNNFDSMDGILFNLLGRIYAMKKFDQVYEGDQKDIAYVIHTSGTTRNGLGGIRVSVPTVSFMDNLDAIRERLQKSSLISARICPLVSEPTFDPCLIEICLPLLHSEGDTAGALVILEEYTTRMPKKLFKDINSVPINLLMMTPSLFMSLLPIHRKAICKGETKICDLLLGGEVFPESLLSLNPENIRLWNMYGTTECSVWAFMGLVESIPISLGLPLGSTEWKIESGRMYLGGLKRMCYLNNETHPVLLRDTGDLVKNEGDSVFFLGRSDSMIKRHGYRIHLTQIVHVIHSLNIFQQFEIVYINQWSLDALVCFYVGSSLSHDYFINKLEDHLPWYSIPSLFSLKNFPLSRHGKVDVRALKELYRASLDCDLPLSVRDIISRRLNLKSHELDISSHFLSNGGSSFVASLVIQEVSALLGVNRLPESDTVKSELLTSLFHESIKDFIDFAESIKKNTHEPQMENIPMQSQEKQIKKIRRAAMKVKWKINLEKCIDSSPVLNDNVLFIGSHSGIFVAIDCSLGLVKWRRRFPSRIEGTAAVSLDGKIITFGCNDHCIYNLCTETGIIKSKFCTDGIVKACALFEKNTNYIWIGSYDHFLYCIDPNKNQAICSINLSGSISSKCVINYRTKRIISCTTKGGFFSLFTERNNLVIDWKIDLLPIFSDPLLETVSGDIFVGCTDGNLYRLCGSNGNTLWKISTGGPIFSSPKFWCNETVVVGSHSSNLFCISENGQCLQTFKAESPVFGTPFPIEDTCFFSSINGIIYFISKTEVMDCIQLNGKVFSSPIYHDSTVYIGCRDDHIYALSISL